MLRRLLAFGLVSAGLITGCGGGHVDADTGAVRAVVLRWLDALDAGDGREFCSLLSGQSLRSALDAARVLGPGTTCAQAESSDPPKTSRALRDQMALARRQAARGLRIDAVSVKGDGATVRYSWIPPAHPSLILEYSRPRHGRVHDTVTLVRKNGHWKIA